MKSRQQRKNAEWVAGLGVIPEFSPEGKAVTGSFPDFSMRVWCNVRGVNIVAYIDRSDAKGRLQRTEVARATWNPPKVTEELVLEWGRRAITRWLEAQLEAEG